MRRSLILAAAIVLMATVANAQDYLKAGQWVLAGATAATVNRQTFSQKDVTGTTTNTSTQVDFTGTYFFSKSIGIGVAVLGQNTSVSESGSGSSDKTTITTYGGGPLIALRFGSGKMTFSIKGAAGIGKNTTTPSGGTASTMDVKFFEGGGGISYHINELASFDVGLRYQKSTIKDSEAAASEPSLDSSGFIFGIGFSLYFGGR